MAATGLRSVKLLWLTSNDADLSGLNDVPMSIDLNIAFLTPLHEEHDFFLKALTQRGFDAQETHIGKLPAKVFPQLNLTLLRGGHGKTQFGIHTQHVLDQLGKFEFELVVCAGAGGALADGVNVGDVVIGTTTVEHDYNLKFVRRPLPRFDGDASALASLKQLAIGDWQFGLHFGPIASGDEDVIEATRGADIQTRTGGLIVAWEGVGGARACRFSGVPFLEIRGATDNANHTALGDFETNLELAMDNIAAVMVAWRKIAMSFER
jgi:adenosylhomocysteine nucleosidase